GALVPAAVLDVPAHHPHAEATICRGPVPLDHDRRPGGPQAGAAVPIGPDFGEQRMHHPGVDAVPAVPHRRRAEHLVHHAVHDNARLTVVHGLVAEPAAHVRAPAPQVEAVAAVVRGPVAVEGIAAAAESEAVLAVVLGDAALDRVALALGDEAGHAVAAEAHADRACQRAPSACEHAHGEPLDRSRTLQREAAAHDEDADALS